MKKSSTRNSLERGRCPAAGSWGQEVVEEQDRFAVQSGLDIKPRTQIFDALRKGWREQSEFLTKLDEALDESALDCANLAADLIYSANADRLDELVSNYRRMCDVLAKEELFFRRNGHYRAGNVEEAERILKEMHDFWPAYLDGLQLSHVFWHNHIRATAYLLHMTRKRLPSKILEIGPGHGLLITQLALENPNASLEAWDITAESLRATETFASAMNVSDRLVVRELDATQADQEHGTFDAIVLYELLEHLDDPAAATRMIAGRLSPGGCIYVNIPINSPAPDHVALFTDSEEITQLAHKAGLVVEEYQLYPQTGYTIEKALRVNATISYVGCWRLEDQSEN